ncbi:unnamed protein product [Acanthoscelides obtectus]|uniref:Uncharacterized protein n=1 Tax=Acanthoscelides obtectus TaxID=200917 RepID=A0A9P0LPF5_ACAOB|nr:unnamed protein product [Acanthoscelides obtectus]CAK1634923.1 Centaurin-gamma-1A [Acanthoscelides obtectus]
MEIKKFLVDIKNIDSQNFHPRKFDAKMNSRVHLQPFLNNSLAIRQEIQRFESVHPSIYAIYDLIDLIPDGIIAQQIRDHVVCIEVTG